MIKQKNITIYFKLALVLFLVSAIYGWLMRLNTVSSFSLINYNRLLQSHSHVTFLGWGFMTITVLFNWLLLDEKIGFSKFYKWIFGIEFSAVALMLISFPLQGYKVFSIVLLSIFLITTYIYIFKFLNDLKTNLTLSLFIKSSLIFYLVSSIGIWAIGIVVATQGKTDLYYNSIYFYLHFLYNGFFVFALFGLLYHYLKIKGIVFNEKYFKLFFIFTALACIPAYTLSLVDSDNIYIIVAGFISSILQLMGLVYLLKLVFKLKLNQSPTLLIKIIFITIIISFVLKTLLQFGSSFPQVSSFINSLKSFFVIGYIHLVTLGFISSFLFFLLIEFKILNIVKSSIKIGLSLFLIGVILTEFTLFGQGSLVLFFEESLPYYNQILFIGSTVIILGLFFTLFQSIMKQK